MQMDHHRSDSWNKSSKKKNEEKEKEIVILRLDPSRPFPSWQRCADEDVLYVYERLCLTHP